jgi:20S proteasome alpha/beta subunit
LLHEWKKDQPKLEARFDLNKDHQIDEKEWMLARAQARREIMKSHREQQRPFNNGVNLLGATKDHRPYILSAYPPGRMVQRYRWQAALSGAGFLLFVITAVWLF